MAELRVGDAAFAGFRLIGGRPGVILAWGVAYFLLAFVPTAFVLWIMWGGHAPLAPAAAIRQARGILQYATVPATAVVYAGVFRAVLRPDERAIAFLRLGRQEARQLLLLIVWNILVFVAAFAAAFASGLIVGVARLALGAYAPWLEIGGPLLIVIAAGWALARLSMAAPMTFAEGRFRLFESWCLTRGCSWRLLGLGALTLVLAVLVYLVALMTLVGVTGLAAGLAKWRGDQMRAFFSQPLGVWGMAAAPYLTVFGVAFGVVIAALQAVLVAPWAHAYRAIVQSPVPDRPRLALRAAFAPIPGGARIGPAWSAPTLLFLIMGFAMVLEIFGVAVWAAVQRSITGQRATGDWTTDLDFTVAYDLLIVAILIAWTAWIERRSLATIGLGPPFSPGLVGWIVLGAGWSMALALALSAGAARDSSAMQLIPPSAAALAQFPVVFVVIVLLAFSEEVMFRGWLLSALAARAGLPVALVVSGLLFAALHVTPWELGSLARLVSFASYTAIGVGLGAVALRKGQIWTSTAIHAGFNGFLAFAAMALNSSTPRQLWKDVQDQARGESELEQAWISLGSNAVIVAALLLWWLLEQKRARSEAAADVAAGRGRLTHRRLGRELRAN